MLQFLHVNTHEACWRKLSLQGWRGKLLLKLQNVNLWVCAVDIAYLNRYHFISFLENEHVLGAK